MANYLCCINRSINGIIIRHYLDILSDSDIVFMDNDDEYSIVDSIRIDENIEYYEYFVAHCVQTVNGIKKGFDLVILVESYKGELKLRNDYIPFTTVVVSLDSLST